LSVLIVDLFCTNYVYHAETPPERVDDSGTIVGPVCAPAACSTGPSRHLRNKQQKSLGHWFYHSSLYGEMFLIFSFVSHLILFHSNKQERTVVGQHPGDPTSDRTGPVFLNRNGRVCGIHTGLCIALALSSPFSRPDAT
jgi:hypothetical protein